MQETVLIRFSAHCERRSRAAARVTLYKHSCELVTATSVQVPEGQ